MPEVIGGTQGHAPATDRRRAKLATKAHTLWMEMGKLWADEGEPLRACDAYEQALNSIGAMQGPGEVSGRPKVDPKSTQSRPKVDS